MLAIKSILATEDEIETLIFDEIDTGISGKTASMVAEKLARISKNHQVLCISHLAQIAANYLIDLNKFVCYPDNLIHPLLFFSNKKSILQMREQIMWNL